MLLGGRWSIPFRDPRSGAPPALVVLGDRASEQGVQARDGLRHRYPLPRARSPPLQAHLQEGITDLDAPGLAIESNRSPETEDGDGQLAHLAQPGRDRLLRDASIAHAARGRR